MEWKSLYLTFVNMVLSIEWFGRIVVLKLKAKRKVKFELTFERRNIGDKNLRMHQF